MKRSYTEQLGYVEGKLDFLIEQLKSLNGIKARIIRLEVVVVLLVGASGITKLTGLW